MAIKRLADDFVVEEQLGAEFLAGIGKRRGPFAVYRLEKRGLSTPEAVGRVQALLRCRPGDVKFGGLKDKQAVTSQTITVTWPASRREAPPGELGRERFALRLLGYSERAVASRDVRSNRFELVVRDISAAAANQLEARARRLALPREGQGERLLTVNYFGAQRFGSVQPGRPFTARQLMDGKFEAALRQILLSRRGYQSREVEAFKATVGRRWGKWKEMLGGLPDLPERRVIEHLAESPQDYRGAFSRLPYLVQAMQIEAYQSYLWNRIATRIAAGLRGAGADGTGKRGSLDAPDRLVGRLHFPEAASVPAEWREASLPMFGRQTRLMEPWRAAAEAVLAEESLELGMLRVPGRERPWFGQSARRLFVEARRFVMGPVEPDDRGTRSGARKRVLAFDLPRGAYATIVLAALGETDDDSGASPDTEGDA